MLDEAVKPQELTSFCQEFYAEQCVKKQLQKLGIMKNNDATPIVIPMPVNNDDQQSISFQKIKVFKNNYS